MVTKEQLLGIFDRTEKPLTLAQLLVELDLPFQEHERVRIVLSELIVEKVLIKSELNCYGLPSVFGLITGVLQVKSKGFGFVIIDNNNDDDVFIAAGDLNGAINGDRVLIRVKQKSWAQDSRTSGVILQILDRKYKQLVGVVKLAKNNVVFVRPDDDSIKTAVLIEPDWPKGLRDGDKVLVELSTSSELHSLQGRIANVLADKDSKREFDLLAIIGKHGLSSSFPDAVLQESEAIPAQISSEEIAERVDLRQRTIVTIDGDDAKDLDDAVSIELLEEGRIRLGVHIADVSYYVTEGSALDQEAWNRGCSVYLLDKVLPMLPEKLSNQVCSLNPNIDRLTLTCDMIFDLAGNVVDYDIYPSLIKTAARMTYNEVTALLESDDQELHIKYKHLLPDLKQMAKLARTLNQRRTKRGAIDFDFPEAKIIVDKEGVPQNIEQKPRTVSERLIEEFMLVANETVAEHFYHLDFPCVYRIHENPDQEKLQSFAQIITSFGYTLKGKTDKIKPKTLQRLLEQIKDTPVESIVSKIMLRTMQQAKYSTKCLGHFGLATTYYTHFTSPIRRYPDLMVHRMIRESIKNKQISKDHADLLLQQLDDAAGQSSKCERIAVDAERELEQCKKVEYMVDKVGESYPGVISGVTSFGMFIELVNTVEGLVHVRDLHDDYFNYDEKQYALIGERKGKVYRIGDAVVIKVSTVNMAEKKIDFELTKHFGTKGKKITRRGSKRKKK